MVTARAVNIPSRTVGGERSSHMHQRTSFILSIILALCVTRSQGQLQYLKGFQRLNTTVTDYYFSCKVTGVFMQWFYNREPLSGFGVGRAGRVVVDTRSDFEYTATILSSEPEGNGQATFVSVLVISFNGTHQKFDVTCSTLVESMTTTANQIANVSNSLGEDGIILDHVLSSQILDDKNKTHIFVCGVPNLFQFLEVNSSAIGFGSGDPIGEDRTVLSDSRKIVDLQGVLIARHPFQSISILFVTESADFTVTCYYESHQVQLHSFTPATTASPVTGTTNDISLERTNFNDVTSTNVSVTTSKVGGTNRTDVETTKESTGVTSKIAGGITTDVVVYLSVLPFFVIILISVVIGAIFFIWKISGHKNRKYNVQDLEIRRWVDIQTKLKVPIIKYNNDDKTEPKEKNAIAIKETELNSSVAAGEQFILQNYDGMDNLGNETQPFWFKCSGDREETVARNQVAVRQQVTLHSSNSEDKPVDGTRPLWNEVRLDLESEQHSEEDKNPKSTASPAAVYITPITSYIDSSEGEYNKCGVFPGRENIFMNIEEENMCDSGSNEMCSHKELPIHQSNMN